ncbi:MAG: phosphoribosylanthranilate isomerase [Rhodothermales bacterium]|nr:phosphoribosylanthranilate isomerase [Rhodothermales bacterium]
MTPRIKICGITTLADARYCAGAGADYLGFIQYPPSPRYLDPAEARAIIDWLYGPEPVGVFVDEPAEAVNAAVETAGFALAQLHGEESPGIVADVAVPVIKAIRVRPGDTVERLRARIAPYLGAAAYILLDTASDAAWGGTGERFDWALAAALAPEVPLFLAGGVSADNVAEAVQTVRPFGLDLSSSLEVAPGHKDFDKITAFFDAVSALQPDAS